MRLYNYFTINNSNFSYWMQYLTSFIVNIHVYIYMYLHDCTNLTCNDSAWSLGTEHGMPTHHLLILNTWHESSHTYIKHVTMYLSSCIVSVNLFNNHVQLQFKNLWVSSNCLAQGTKSHIIKMGGGVFIFLYPKKSQFQNYFVKVKKSLLL